MNAEDFKKRTKTFALRIVRLVNSLPVGKVGEVLGRQLLRAGTSVGANYRSACRAKSRADFISKMTIVEEESDECIYWIELIEESSLVQAQRLADLKKEAEEILAITVASINTARKNCRAADKTSRIGTNAREMGKSGN